MSRDHSTGDGRFTNPWRPGNERSVTDILRWFVSPNPFRKEKKRVVRFPLERPDFRGLVDSDRDFIVWLGHSTVVIRTAGKTVITDPVFWNINPFIRRKTPLPVPPEEVPPPDVVLMSHGHFDHFNTRTLRYLRKSHDPVFVTGPGYGRYRRALGRAPHVELDWGEVFHINDLRITALPAQHWSRRGITDTNRALWCSYLLEGANGRYYWAGDSGYFDGFREAGREYGPFDAAMLPIGAYEPRWFMGPNHMSPGEAVRAAEELRARVFIPIHWGTFDLSDEPLTLPPEELLREYGGRKTPELVMLRHGGAWLGPGP